MAKRILLSYLDRNKPITIPEEVKDTVSYLKQEFVKNFNFAPNVKLSIVFQKFEEEWNEFVDLEDDAVIRNKEKLKVVVTPLLTDTSQCSNSVEDTEEVRRSINFTV